MVAIGFAAPLTGPQALVGVPMCRAVALAIESHNTERARARQVRFIPVDDGATAEGAIAAAQHLLAAADLVGVVGHKNSDCCAAAGEHYAGARVAQITASATNSDLSRRGWPTFFRVCADNERQAAAACEAMRAFGLHGVAVVHDATAYGRPLAEAVAWRLPSMTMTLAAMLELPARRADHTTIAAVADAVLASGADGLFAGLTEIEGSLLVRELRGRGHPMPLFGAEGGPTAAFLELAGAAANGCYHTYAGVDPYAAPSAAGFVRLYERRYGRAPSGFAAECYDTAGILLRAIGTSHQPDRESVLEAIRHMPPYEGASGTIRFDANGERQGAGVSLWAMQDGVTRSITPEELHGQGNVAARH